MTFKWAEFLFINVAWLLEEKELFVAIEVLQIHNEPLHLLLRDVGAFRVGSTLFEDEVIWL